MALIYKSQKKAIAYLNKFRDYETFFYFLTMTYYSKESLGEKIYDFELNFFFSDLAIFGDLRKLADFTVYTSIALPSKQKEIFEWS